MAHSVDLFLADLDEQLSDSEGQVPVIAPNLSAIVGNTVAAKLMVTAGGLASLAKMPAFKVLLLGATSQDGVGYIEQTEILQTTPPALKILASRLLAAKSTLAARVDCTRGDPSGDTGKTLREEIRRKVEKWQRAHPQF